MKLKQMGAADCNPSKLHTFKNEHFRAGSINFDVSAALSQSLTATQLDYREQWLPHLEDLTNLQQII